MDDASSALRAVRSSHDRLTALIPGLSTAQLSQRSYCTAWTVADVLSHLGSQAEIFSMFVDAGLNGAEPPGPAAFGPIWDVWNAKSPSEQAGDFVTADATLVERLEGLDEVALILNGHGSQIAGFERRQRAEQPWLHSGD